MFNQKGQIEVLFLLVVLAGVAIWFFVSYKPSSRSGSPGQAIPAPSLSSPQEQNKESQLSPSLAADNSTPFRFNPQPSAGLPAETRKIAIGLETDEKAVCKYATVAGMSYDSMQYTFSSTNNVFHSSLITGLSEGTAYNYYIKCADQAGNKNIDDFVIAFWVRGPDDFFPPVISNQYPTGDVLHYDTTSTIIGLGTNEPASCRYSTGQGTAYNSMARNLTDDGTKKYHTAQITGLSPGNNYNYFVRCKDLKGNVNTGDVMIYFSIGE